MNYDVYYFNPGRYPFCGFTQPTWNWIDQKDTLEKAIARAKDIAKHSGVKTEVRITFLPPA